MVVHSIAKMPQRSGMQYGTLNCTRCQADAA
jgi:hypothetical protein